jgi:hypothetical protein
VIITVDKNHALTIIHEGELKKLSWPWNKVDISVPSRGPWWPKRSNSSNSGIY